MNQPHTVFFIGKPGSGKGTQARILAQRTGWKILASGAQFRSIAEEDTVVGRRVRDDLAQGLLMPHWFAMYLYQRALFSVGEEESVIFDGFNRKLQEAELNVATLEWVGRPFKVVNISVSDDEVRRRLEGRAHTSGRSDDRQDAVEERLEEYAEHTLKALEIFRAKGALIDIDGEQSPEEVAQAVHTALGL
ncbi:MAG: adenylate kinase [Parcubacteria bacterium C7867-007]|nr:MAG: adenylate kinase [Parcubacteria bacterium C7867-007]